jgi:hypothetical protein
MPRRPLLVSDQVPPSSNTGSLRRCRNTVHLPARPHTGHLPARTHMDHVPAPLEARVPRTATNAGDVDHAKTITALARRARRAGTLQTAADTHAANVLPIIQ